MPATRSDKVTTFSKMPRWVLAAKLCGETQSPSAPVGFIKCCTNASLLKPTRIQL